MNEKYNKATAKCRDLETAKTELESNKTKLEDDIDRINEEQKTWRSKEQEWKAIVHEYQAYVGLSFSFSEYFMEEITMYLLHSIRFFFIVASKTSDYPCHLHLHLNGFPNLQKTYRLNPFVSGSMTPNMTLTSFKEV
jgi:hypothetical protein